MTLETFCVLRECCIVASLIVFAVALTAGAWSGCGLSTTELHPAVKVHVLDNCAVVVSMAGLALVLAEVVDGITSDLDVVVGVVALGILYVEDWLVGIDVRAELLTFVLLVTLLVDLECSIVENRWNDFGGILEANRDVVWLSSLVEEPDVVD